MSIDKRFILTQSHFNVSHFRTMRTHAIENQKQTLKTILNDISSSSSWSSAEELWAWYVWFDYVGYKHISKNDHATVFALNVHCIDKSPRERNKIRSTYTHTTNLKLVIWAQLNRFFDSFHSTSTICIHLTVVAYLNFFMSYLVNLYKKKQTMLL